MIKTILRIFGLIPFVLWLLKWGILLTVFASIPLSFWYLQKPPEGRQEIREKFNSFKENQLPALSDEIGKWSSKLRLEELTQKAGLSFQQIQPKVRADYLPEPDHFNPRETSYYVLGGIPHSDIKLTLIKNDGYLLAYDEKTKNPAWVAYRLYYDHSHQAPPRPDIGFSTDTRTLSRISTRAYTRTGYDRGHMAPSKAIGKVYGEQAQAETFTMSNVAPQSPGLNRNIWRELEKTIIDEWVREHQSLWVITGPIYSSKRLKFKKSGVQIPTAFFKIITDVTPDAELRTISFIMPQEAHDFDLIEDYLASVDQVEFLTGLDFFSDLPDDAENQLEGFTSPSIW